MGVQRGEEEEEEGGREREGILSWFSSGDPAGGVKTEMMPPGPSGLTCRLLLALLRTSRVLDTETDAERR